MNKVEFEKVFAETAEKSGVAKMARDYQFAENLQRMMIDLRDKLCPAEQQIKISEYLSARKQISDYLHNLISDQAHRGAPMLQYGDGRINEEVDLILKMAIRELNKKVLTEQPNDELEENIEEKINEYWNEWFSHGEYFEGTLPKNVFSAYCHKISSWQKEQMLKSAVSIGYLQDWYQNSIDEEVPPIWTDKHLNELTKDFYIIPKQKEDEQCSTE